MGIIIPACSFNPAPDPRATCVLGEIKKGQIPTGLQGINDVWTSVCFPFNDSLSIHLVPGRRIELDIQKVKTHRHISHPGMSG